MGLGVGLGRSARLALLLGAAAVALAACGPGGDAGSADSITVYSGQHPQTAQKLADDFTARTGIKVNLRSAGEGDLANQLLREGSDTPADVFFAENPPALAILDQKGMLAPVAASTLALAPAADNPRSGNWVAISARAVTLVYNIDQIKPADLPGSIYELAGGSWKGRLGLAPSETDFQPVVTTVINQRGQDGATQWLTGLKGNARVYDDNESLVAAVNKGEVAAGVVDHYYWYRLQEELGAARMHSALAYFGKGDPGSLVDISGAAVLASTHRADQAQRFLAYLAGKDGQSIIAAGSSFEYPLASGVSTTRVLKPLAELALPTAELGDGSQAVALLQKVGLL